MTTDIPVLTKYKTSLSFYVAKADRGEFSDKDSGMANVLSDSKTPWFSLISIPTRWGLRMYGNAVRARRSYTAFKKWQSTVGENWLDKAMEYISPAIIESGRKIIAAMEKNGRTPVEVINMVKREYGISS